MVRIVTDEITPNIYTNFHILMTKLMPVAKKHVSAISVAKLSVAKLSVAKLSAAKLKSVANVINTVKQIKESNIYE